MSRIQEILIRARDTLADAGVERWSDERLLRLVDDAQKDIAKQTRLLKGEVNIYTVSGTHTYALPADVWLITRAAFNECKIPLYTHDELDELVRTRVMNVNDENYYTRRGTNTRDFSFVNYCWELEEDSEVEAILYDRRNMDEIRVFPIPLAEVDTLSSDFGVVTKYAEDSPASPFGVLTAITDLAEPFIFNEDFGVTTAASVSGAVHLWYIKIPPALNTVLDELSLPPMWDVAMRFYVISHAFDDDMDTRFAEKSAKALAFYERELGVAKKTDNLDGVRSSQYRSDYRGAFE